MSGFWTLIEIKLVQIYRHPLMKSRVSNEHSNLWTVSYLTCTVTKICLSIHDIYLPTYLTTYLPCPTFHLPTYSPIYPLTDYLSVPVLVWRLWHHQIQPVKMADTGLLSYSPSAHLTVYTIPVILLSPPVCSLPSPTQVFNSCVCVFNPLNTFLPLISVCWSGCYIPAPIL